MSRTPQDRHELLTHLRTQVGFLHKSAAAFDAGDQAEAQRLALTLRVLLHDARRSHSLLKQLGLLDTLRFHDTSGRQPQGQLSIGGLVWMQVGRQPMFMAPLGRTEVLAKLPFTEWWTAPTLRAPHPVTGDGVDYSRGQLVLTVANQDGGGHVDPSVEAPYYSFTRGGVADVAIGGKPVQWDSNPVPAAIRQVAHEVLSTLEEQAVTELADRTAP